MTAGRLRMRLLGQRLTQNDVAKIGVFLRIGQQKLRCDWSLVDDGEVDVLIVSGAESDTVPGLLSTPRAALHVVDAPDLTDALRASLPAVLARPLQYEAFIDELARLERRLAGPGDVPAAPAVLPVTPAPAPAQPLPKSGQVQSLPVPVPVPVRREIVVAATQPELVVGALYRLRRWPSTEVLRGHRYFVRLASFLSTRHVDLAELARLSNVGVAECQEFLRKLLAVDLLDVRLQATASMAVGAARLSTPAPPTSPTQPGKRQAEPGLFNRIRQRLGMGGTR